MRSSSLRRWVRPFAPAAGALMLSCAGHAVRATPDLLPDVASPAPRLSPAPPFALPATAPAHQTVRGEVSAYTYEPTGAADGFVLDSGETVHFPPSAATAVSSIASQGGVVEVTGFPRRTSRGEAVLEAAIVSNPRTQQSVNVGALAPHPREAELPALSPAGAPPPQ